MPHLLTAPQKHYLLYPPNIHLFLSPLPKTRKRRANRIPPKIIIVINQKVLQSPKVLEARRLNPKTKNRPCFTSYTFLKIIQFNCLSYNTSKLFIKAYLEEEHPDILLLNSTGLPNTPIKHYGYTTKYTTETHNDGIAILIKSTLSKEFISHPWLNKHFLAVKVHTEHGYINIATTYTRPNTAIPYTDLNTLFNYNNPTFILADFNAAHTNFNHNQCDPHGRQLNTIVNHKNLRYLGPDFYTYYATHQQNTRKGRPDLVLANRQTLQFHHHLSPGPLSGSDHIPIVLRISTSPIYIPCPPRLDYKNTNWESFKDTIAEHPFRQDFDGLPFHVLDTSAEELHTTIKNTVNMYTPVTTYKSYTTFTPSIRSQRLLTCYRNKFQINKDRYHTIRWDINILKRHIINSLQEDHNKHWHNIIKETETHRCPAPATFWRRIQKLQGQTKDNFDHLKINNIKITDPEEVAESFRTHWERIFTPHPITPIRNIQQHIHNIEQHILTEQNNLQHDNIINLNNLNPADPLIAPFQYGEVKQALQTVRRRAPGPDGNTHLALRALPPPTIEAITSLFNASLACGYLPKTFKTADIRLIPKPNKTLTDPSNYRPISLLSLLGKLLEKLINTRLRLHLDFHDSIPPFQFGFRQYCSTEDALNCILSYIEANRRARRRTLLVTTDINKAFDTVWHNGLKYKILNNFHFPPPIIKFLCNYLTDRQCRIRHKTALSNYFTPSSGVPQGSVLAPTLFNMFTHDIPQTTHPDNLLIQYADDLTLLTRGLYTDTLTNRMQGELNSISSWQRKWRIVTNPLKSRALFFNIKSERPRQLFLSNNPQHLAGAPIPRVNTVTVLGLNIDSRFTFRQHITSKTANASKTLSNFSRFRYAFPKTKRHLYLALILPTLTYCPLALTLTAKSNKILIQRVQSNSFRFINNTKWNDFVSNEDLHNLTKRPPLNVVIHNKIKKQVTKFSLIRPEILEFLHRISLCRYNPQGITALHPEFYPDIIEPTYK